MIGILALSVLISVLFQPNRVVFADVFTGFDGGNGTVGNPFLISSAVQLNEIRSNVTASYRLTANINLSDYTNWVPIGSLTFAARFKGSLDGNGHTITNLAINRPTTDYVGLFGHIHAGTIKNLRIAGASITGQSHVGVLAGRIEGEFEGQQATISNSGSSGGSVTGSSYVGGLVGSSLRGRIDNSYSSVSVIGTAYDVGGLLGSNGQGTISYSYATGNVISPLGIYVGGLVGSNNAVSVTSSQSLIEMSYATGEVEGKNDVGGLLGLNDSRGLASSNTNIRDSYAGGKVTGIDRVGGLVGYNYNGLIDNGYALGEVIGTIQVGGLVGHRDTDTINTSYYDRETTEINAVSDFSRSTELMKTLSNYSGWAMGSTWGMDDGINDGYPYLRYLAPVLVAAAAVGDTAGTTKITAAADFGNHLVIKVSSSQFTIPSIRNMVSESEVINPYDSGTDISGVDAATNKYVAVYEVDKENKVLKFTQITLTINDIQPSYAIEELADLIMTPLTVGYASGAQQTKTVAITRTGTEDLAGLAVTISGTDYEVTQPAITTLTSGTPSTSFTVRAKDGLTAGTYTATVTVSADHMTNKTFTVTQVVRQARPSDDSTGTTTIQPPIQPIIKATIDLGNESTGATMHVKAVVVTSADGTTSSNVVVDHDQFVQMLNSIQSKETAAKLITIAVEGKVDRLNVEIPIAAIGNEVGVNTNAYLIIETDLTAYRIPLSLLEGLSTNLGGNLLITMNQLSGQLYDSMYKVAKRQELLILINPIEFKLSIKDQEIIEFGDIYVERLVRVGSEVDLSKATAVWYDPATEIFHFVPAIINEIGGATNIVMKSPHNSIYTLVQSNKTFSDLHGHWEKDDIEKLASKLIVSRKSATEFVPNAMITRAEFVALLVRSLGIAVTDAKSSFQDVNENAWFTDEIEAAVKAGLVRGFSDDTFHPEHLITREQIAIIMAAALEYVDSQLEKSELVPNLIERFSDADQIHSWARNAATISIKAGIISGRTEATFAPMATATRAEAVTMLARMLRYIQFIN